jgi:hypothetical protein
MRNISTVLAVAVASVALVPLAQAHFKLEQPASWIEEDERGNPQKLAPCGGTVADGGTRTGAVTEVQGGQMLRVVVAESVFHPGHYRIALARSPNLLPADPVVMMKETERGPRSESAVIDTDATPPTLVDGLWPHTESPSENWVTEIEIPNIDCAGCFLQIIQFMAEHPGFREGGFSYHHCAMLNITADQSLPIDSRW